MRQNPKIMNAGNMAFATERAKDYTQSIIEHAKNIETDPQKKERLIAKECKACYYSSRIGGQAFTDRPCMSCGKVESYSSTATDVLCSECATKHSLCKYCGGDIEMKMRRQWPKPIQEDR